LFLDAARVTKVRQRAPDQPRPAEAGELQPCAAADGESSRWIAWVKFCVAAREALGGAKPQNLPAPLRMVVADRVRIARECAKGKQFTGERPASAQFVLGVISGKDSDIQRSVEAEPGCN